VSHLPIVNNVDFLGLISEFDIYNLNSPEANLGDHKLSLSRAFVMQYQHVYDVIRLIGEQKLTLLPVLDEKNKYLGSITLNNLVEQFSKITSIENPGGIIVLEVSQNDYVLSEIAKIIESDDAKIISLFLTSHPDSTKLEVSMKVNKMEIGPILQTLNRYDYIIKASYSEDQQLLDDLQNRYDSLMKYLNIGGE
jgi:CBS domain-containing protein